VLFRSSPSSQHVKCTTEKIFLTQEYRKYFSSKQTQKLEMLQFNSNSPRCSFEIILFILRLEAKRRNYKRLETITINHLKIIIAQFYIDAIDKQYTEGIKERFAKLLKYYGMESISDEYRIKFIANDDDNFIETLPFFESYHLTRLDIWILATYYKIPIIILYYPNKSLIETKDEYSILTTYFEENISESIREEPGMGMSVGMGTGKKSEDSDEELPVMGQSAYDVAVDIEKSSNVQGYYFIVAPSIKANVVPAYSIIFRKESKRFESERSETSETSEPTTANEYYIPMNILTHSFQSTVIQQQSTQYIDPEGPAHSEDDESSQMKESVRYKKSIMQFIQNFKPPSKKGRMDDSSSVGTGISFDTQEEEDIVDMSLTSVVGKKMKKPVKKIPKINISAALSTEASGIEPSAAVQKTQKRLPRKKGKGLAINVSSLNLSPEEQEPGAVTTSSALVEPTKKPKLKKLSKLNITPSKLPLFGVGEPEEEPELSDIPEVSEDI